MNALEKAVGSKKKSKSRGKKKSAGRKKAMAKKKAKKKGKKRAKKASKKSASRKRKDPKRVAAGKKAAKAKAAKKAKRQKAGRKAAATRKRKKAVKKATRKKAARKTKKKSTRKKSSRKKSSKRKKTTKKKGKSMKKRSNPAKVLGIRAKDIVPDTKMVKNVAGGIVGFSGTVAASAVVERQLARLAPGLAQNILIKRGISVLVAMGLGRLLMKADRNFGKYAQVGGLIGVGQLIVSDVRTRMGLSGYVSAKRYPVSTLSGADRYRMTKMFPTTTIGQIPTPIGTYVEKRAYPAAVIGKYGSNYGAGRFSSFMS